MVGDYMVILDCEDETIPELEKFLREITSATDVKSRKSNSSSWVIDFNLENTTKFDEFLDMLTTIDLGLSFYARPSQTDPEMETLVFFGVRNSDE